MADGSSDQYFTTKELAELLRIKERKIYDLAASGDVPCVRVVGKLLFPKSEIEAWMADARSGPRGISPPPNVIAGSHDPLLDWAVRESGCGIAAIFDGSFDGLARFSERQAMACGIHVHEPEGWNIETARRAVGPQPVVMLGLWRRQRGLIVARDNPKAIAGIRDLVGLRFARRQESSASHRLFVSLAQAEKLASSSLDGPKTAARTEDEVALLVHEGEADAALGLMSVASRFGLGFVPLLEEHFDMLVWRQAFFEPQFQRLWSFLHSATFEAKANGAPGYDISELGRVRLNGAAR